MAIDRRLQACRQKTDDGKWEPSRRAAREQVRDDRNGHGRKSHPCPRLQERHYALAAMRLAAVAAADRRSSQERSARAGAMSVGISA